jgi:hypothetical protein
MTTDRMRFATTRPDARRAAPLTRSTGPGAREGGDEKGDHAAPQTDPPRGRNADA